MLNIGRPPRKRRNTTSRAREKPSLVSVSTSGEILGRTENKLPLNTALPKVAEAPQQRVASAINKYPRHGCCTAAGEARITASADLPGKHLVQLVRIEADHDLLAHDNGWRGTAVVLPNQFKDCYLVHTHILHFKINSSRREVGLGHFPARSSRLAVDPDFFLLHQKAPELLFRFDRFLARFILLGAAPRLGPRLSGGPQLKSARSFSTSPKLSSTSLLTDALHLPRLFAKLARQRCRSI